MTESERRVIDAAKWEFVIEGRDTEPEPTYCAECAENGLVLPHPCPRVTVAPLAVVPKGETDCAEVVPPEGEGPYHLTSEVRDGRTVGVLTGPGYEGGVTVTDQPEVAWERISNHAFTAGQKGRSDCGEVGADASWEFCRDAAAHVVHFYNNSTAGDPPDADLLRDLIHETIEDDDWRVTPAAPASRREGEPPTDATATWDAIRRGTLVPRPPSPDLVAAARKAVEKYWAWANSDDDGGVTAVDDAIDNLMTALRNTPQPEAAAGNLPAIFCAKPTTDECVWWQVVGPLGRIMAISLCSQESTAQEIATQLNAAVAASRAERPTGTIFELDLFRERLERVTESRLSLERFDEAELRKAIAELKTLIDNVQAQYCPSQPVSGDVVAAREIAEAAEAFIQSVKRLDVPSWDSVGNKAQMRDARDELEAKIAALSSSPSQPSKGVTLVGELCEWPNGDLYLDDVRLGGALAATNLHREDVDPERLPGHETYGPVTVSITPKEQA